MSVFLLEFLNSVEENVQLSKQLYDIITLWYYWVIFSFQ